MTRNKRVLLCRKFEIGCKAFLQRMDRLSNRPNEKPETGYQIRSDTNFDIRLDTKGKGYPVHPYFSSFFSACFYFFLASAAALVFSFIEVTLMLCPRILIGPSLRTLLTRAGLSKTICPYTTSLTGLLCTYVCRIC